MSRTHATEAHGLSYALRPDPEDDSVLTLVPVLWQEDDFTRFQTPWLSTGKEAPEVTAMRFRFYDTKTRHAILVERARNNWKSWQRYYRRSREGRHDLFRRLIAPLPVQGGRIEEK